MDAMASRESAIDVIAIRNMVNRTRYVGDKRGKALLRVIATRHVQRLRSLSFDREEYSVVRCREHDRVELVPSQNYRYDLQIWYRNGRHPRFSVLEILLDEDQRYEEILGVIQGRDGRIGRQVRKVLGDPDRFRERIAPHLFADYRFRGRRLRIPRWMAKKAEAKSFTARDFFATDNQEWRRIILARGCPIDKVCASLKPGRVDSEGRIFYTRSGDVYCRVCCPSTGQEYLLSVPRRPPDGLVWTPRKARRWGFNLPTDAVFAAEA